MMQHAIKRACMAGLALAVCGAAWANTPESSTMVFQGTLTEVAPGVFTGVLPMTVGAYYVPGGPGEAVSDAGGFDLYAKEGAIGYIDRNGDWDFDDANESGPIGADHDAYSETGPWGAYYDPDCPDYQHYWLVLEPDHWYVAYSSSGAPVPDPTYGYYAPMGGVIDYSTMYAPETDTAATASGTAPNGGPGKWDMAWTWGAECIPLQYPGYSLMLIPEPTPDTYTVIMTPAALPMMVVDDDWAGLPVGTIIEPGLYFGVNAFATITEAVAAASEGAIDVRPGAYAESITLNKPLSILGSGSGDDPNVDTIITSSTQATALRIAASGQPGIPLLLKDLRIVPTNCYGIEVHNGVSVSNLEWQNVKVVGPTPATIENEVGFKVATDGSVDNLVVTNCAFDGCDYGWYFAKHGDWGPGGSNVTNVSVTGTSFDNNSYKGIYVEKLSNAAFTNCTFNSNGADEFWNQDWNAGADINLKGVESYVNIAFICCDFLNNALGCKEGAALMIKARDDGATYSLYPATLMGVTISGGVIQGNERGARFGEPGKDNTGPTNVTISDVSLLASAPTYAGGDGSAYGELIDQRGAGADAIDASDNWWGDPSGPPAGAVYSANSPAPTVSPFLNAPSSACGAEVTQLTLNTADTCLNATEDEVIVTIDVTNAQTAYVGGQFVLSYDDAKLALVSAVPGAGLSQLYLDASTPGELVYAVNAAAGDPGTTDDATLATVTFAVMTGVEFCETAGLVAFMPNDPPTRLVAAGGDPIYPQLTDLGEVTKDNTPPTLTCPPDLTLENDPGLCSAALVNVETFDEAVCLTSSQTSGCWYPDRYAPGAFENAVLGGENVLKLSISQADSWGSRPSGQQSSFYNYQGRKLDVGLAVGSIVSVDLYIPASWDGKARSASMWGTADDYAGAVGGYPIMGFLSCDPSDPYNPTPAAANVVAGFRIWKDEDHNYGWVDLGLPAGFAYDAWYTLSMEISENAYEYTITGAGGSLTYSYPRLDTVTRVRNVMLQGYNFGSSTYPTCEAYDIYFDNLTVGPVGPIVIDNCSFASLTYERSDNAALTLDDPFPVGVTTVTWTATDDCGNSDYCVQTVTVLDTEPPVITPGVIDSCYADVSTAESAAIVATSATDNCSAPVDLVWTIDTVGDCSGAINIAIADEAGNTSYVIYTTRIDGEAPAITAGDVSVVNDPGVCYAVVTWTPPIATDNCDDSIGYFEGFEDIGFVAPPITSGLPGWQSYDSELTAVASGTDGITSADGAGHGQITPPGPGGAYSGAFTRLGGYRNVFGGGFVVTLDVYLDLNDPAVVADTYGWDLTTAVSGQDGDHRRDFIFHTASNAAGHILVAGSNNTNFTRRNDLASINHYEVTTSGWYTFEWVFREGDPGVLAVDLNLVDNTGVTLWTETRSNASDLLDTIVGGNRYMWFTFLETDALAIDNTTLVTYGAPVEVVCTPPSGSTFPVGVTTVDVEATDACGNVENSSFTVTVTDVEPPVISCNNTDMTVYADAGQLSAVVTWNAATATDNCSVDTIVYDIDVDNDGVVDATQAGTTYTLPIGVHKVTAVATDIHGVASDCSFLVTVSDLSLMQATVELDGVVHPGPFTRCVTFVLWDCVSSPIEVKAVMTFTNSVASATIEVPAGGYMCATAQDELHTLRMTDGDFHVSGVEFVADFTGDDALIGGNFNGDTWVDILDFGVYTYQWGVSVGADTDCATVGPHADANGDGDVDTADFTFIQLNFFVGNEANCCVVAPLQLAALGGPVSSITVDELEARGLAYLRVADINGDGVLNEADVAAFATGVRPQASLIGDVNGDGAVNAFDIDPFVTALVDPAGYAAQYPDVVGNPADVNRDGAVNAFDIDAFVAVLCR